MRPSREIALLGVQLRSTVRDATDIIRSMHHSAHNQVGHDHSRHLCDWFDNNGDENSGMEHWIASGGLCCVHGDGLAGVGHDNHAAASDCCLPPFMRGPAFAALMFDDGTRVLLEDGGDE